MLPGIWGPAFTAWHLSKWTLKDKCSKEEILCQPIDNDRHFAVTEANAAFWHTRKAYYIRDLWDQQNHRWHSKQSFTRSKHLKQTFPCPHFDAHLKNTIAKMPAGWKRIVESRYELEGKVIKLQHKILFWDTDVAKVTKASGTELEIVPWYGNKCEYN